VIIKIHPHARFQNRWKDHYYQTKQLEVYGIEENDDFIVLTVIVKYF